MSSTSITGNRAPKLQHTSSEQHRGEKPDQRRMTKKSYRPEVESWASWLFRNLHIVYLFTASDFKTIVFPETAFGIFTALSGPFLVNNNLAPASVILTRIPLVMLWVWINLLPFALANQSQPLAILEDKINKPWRPLPSSIITPRAARWLMFWSYAAALLISIALRCELQCVALMILGGLYNDLGGADSNCVFRNLLNAAGYTSFASGATVVAITPSSLNKLAYKWFGMILLIVFSTVQVQDMQDQDGDRIRGRKTVPLVIGDWKARWTVAIGVSLWSFAAPTFWEASLAGYAAPVVLGLFVAHRVLSKHTCQEDARTFKLWNIWIMTVYLVPLVKRLTGATNWPAQS